MQSRAVCQVLREAKKRRGWWGDSVARGLWEEENNTSFDFDFDHMKKRATKYSYVCIFLSLSLVPWI
jgi:hypothetical protein